MKGEFAISKAGHDKGKIYVVVGVEGDFAYLANGKERTIANPKKKRLKHIQPIHKEKPEDAGTDEMIKRAIKLYVQRNAGKLMEE